jgi:hypothetical protein
MYIVWSLRLTLILAKLMTTMIQIKTRSHPMQSLVRNILIIISLVVLFPASLIAGTVNEQGSDNDIEKELGLNKIIPLEASIDGMQLSDYEMYWQLNDDDPVLMKNVFGSDGGKKISSLDISFLSLSEEKNIIKFTAVDNNKDVISVRAVEIIKR